MKNLSLILIGVLFVLSGVKADAKSSHGSSRPHYSGAQHSSSHGGHYKGGSGKSHKGGTYKNSKTGDQYGKHKD